MTRVPPRWPCAQSIAGLSHEAHWLSERQAETLMKHVDAGPWLQPLRRRVQHYGYAYDYSVDAVCRTPLGPWPAWLDALRRRLLEEGWMHGLADQATINEYPPGRGIARHVECQRSFGEVLCSISLASGCEMNFTRVEDGERRALWLAPGSLLVLRGEARHAWQHGIASRKTDRRGEVPGVRKRERRLSITLRTLCVSGAP